MTADEARRRIKKWCLAGLDIPDEAGAKELNMNENPRWYLEEDVLPEAEYDQELAHMTLS